MQVVRTDPMAQDAAQAPRCHQSDFIRCTFQKSFRTSMSARDLPPGPTTQRSAEHHEKLHWPVN